jgi:hypothetical protein
MMTIAMGTGNEDGLVRKYKGASDENRSSSMSSVSAK